jgi:rhamnogalacturonyl hydrolase YesR
VKLRIGRKNMRTLYLQRYEEPSSADPCVGFAVDWHTGVALCTAVNALEDPKRAEVLDHLEEMARMANWVEGVTKVAGD